MRFSCSSSRKTCSSVCFHNLKERSCDPVTNKCPVTQHGENAVPPDLRGGEGRGGEGRGGLPCDERARDQTSAW